MPSSVLGYGSGISRLPPEKSAKNFACLEKSGVWKETTFRKGSRTEMPSHESGLVSRRIPVAGARNDLSTLHLQNYPLEMPPLGGGF